MVGTDLARAPTAPRAAPTSSALGSTGLLRRRAPPGAGGKASSLQRYYTDDVPGLKISPVAVLVMSVCFIAFVSTLHIFGKLVAFSTKKR